MWWDKDNGEGDLKGFQLIEIFDIFEIGLNSTIPKISNLGVHLMFEIFEIFGMWSISSKGVWGCGGMRIIG